MSRVSNKRGVSRGPYKKQGTELKTWSYHAQASGDELLKAIDKAVRSNVPESMRTDICQQAYLVLLERPRTKLGDAIREASKLYRQSERGSPLSLDYPAPGRTEGALRDIIAAPATLPKRGRARNGRTILKYRCKECSTHFYRCQDSSRGTEGHFKTNEFCSKKCKQTWLIRSKGYKKLPGAEELRRLYEVERLSCLAIGRIFGASDSGVRHAMDAAGIKRRPAGFKKGGAQTCKHPECDKPTYKIKHGKDSNMYGTFCYQHWRIENARRKRVCARKKNVTPYCRWRYQNEAPTGAD